MYVIVMVMKEDFNNVLLRVIDTQLKEIFGKAGAQIIYDHLANHYSLKRENIPERIDVFARGLENYLGSGAHAIQHMLLRMVYSRFGRTFKENCGFAESVAQLRESLVRSKRAAVIQSQRT